MHEPPARPGPRQRHVSNPAFLFLLHFAGQESSTLALKLFCIFVHSPKRNTRTVIAFHCTCKEFKASTFSHRFLHFQKAAAAVPKRALLQKWFTVVPCLSYPGPRGTNFCKLTKRKALLERNKSWGSLRRGESSNEDKHAMYEDLIQLRPPPGARLIKTLIQSAEPVTLVNPPPPDNHVSVQRDTVVLSLRGLLCFSLREKLCCRCRLLASSWLCFHSEARCGVRPALRHAHAVEEITEGRM